MIASDKQRQSVVSLEVLLYVKLSELTPRCHVVMVSDHPGDIYDLRVDRRGLGCTDGVCVSVSLQHPPLPCHIAPYDGLTHCHGECHIVTVSVCRHHGECVPL